MSKKGKFLREKSPLFNFKFGKHHSEETKVKMRDAKIDRKHTQETKLRINEAKLGRRLSDTHKVNLSIALRGKRYISQSLPVIVTNFLTK